MLLFAIHVGIRSFISRGAANADFLNSERRLDETSPPLLAKIKNLY